MHKVASLTLIFLCLTYNSNIKIREAETLKKLSEVHLPVMLYPSIASIAHLNLVGLYIN
jgi:hypothetical protein